MKILSSQELAETAWESAMLAYRSGFSATSRALFEISAAASGGSLGVPELVADDNSLSPTNFLLNFLETENKSER